MLSIRSNLDLFNYLQQNAPQSFRSIVNADGVTLRSYGMFDTGDGRTRMWLVDVERKHGSHRTIAVVINPVIPNTYSCKMWNKPLPTEVHQ